MRLAAVFAMGLYSALLSGCALVEHFERLLPPGDSEGRRDLRVRDHYTIQAKPPGNNGFPGVPACIEGKYTGRHIREVAGNTQLYRWKNEDGGSTYAVAVPFTEVYPGSTYLGLPRHTVEHRNVFNLITDENDIVRRCVWDRFRE